MSDTIMIVDDEHEIADLIEVYLKMKTLKSSSFILRQMLWHV